MNPFIAGLVACVLNIIAVSIIIIVAKKNNWYDSIDERKIHTGNIPRLGGIGIFWSFFITLLFFSFFVEHYNTQALNFVYIACAMLIVHIIGLIDDFKNLKAVLKFLVHILAACLVVFSGYRFYSIYVPFYGVLELGFLSYPLTILWIVGVINAINMIDGLDGLSGGISVIACFAFGIIFLDKGLAIPALTSITLVGSIIGYLFFNLPPAKTFMGDSGSNFLGFALAIMPLLDKAGNNGFWFWDGVTILLLPIFDVFAAIIRRSKKHKSVMSPDKWHIHHKLLRLGFSTRSILIILYTVCMLLGIVAISVVILKPIWHFALIMASWLILAIGFTILHFFKEKTLSVEEATEK